MSFTFLEALAVGLYYYVANLDVVAFPFACVSLQDAAFTGLVLGVVFGDVQTGLILGATIALIYMGAMAAGGTLPSDQCIAACIVVPIAIKSGMDIDTAVALSIPLATIGAMLDNVRRISAGIWHRKAEKHLKQQQFHKFTLDATVGPLCVSALLRIVPVTALLYIFGGMAGEVVQRFPEWLLNAFGVMTDLLPGIGFSLLVNFIGKPYLIPYYFFGFILAKLAGLGSITIAVISVCAAFLHVQFIRFEDDSSVAQHVDAVPAPNDAPPTKGKLSNRELFASGYHFFFWFRVAQCVEYLYSTSVSWALMKPLKKIYGKNKEGLSKALLRHMEPYICSPTCSTLALGATLAMDEDIAQNGDPTGEKGETISTLRTSTMGVLLSLGDSLELPLIWPILKSIFYPLALQGMIIGAFPSHFFNLFGNIVGMILWFTGYRLGRTGLAKILNSPKLKKILLGAAVVGMAMLGSMTAGNVDLSLAVTYTSNGVTNSLNGVFDGIMPGFLTLAYMAVLYYAEKKGVNLTLLLCVVCVLALVGAFFGIL